jgi:putative nucleotidyltransferase-like protein
MSAESRFVLSAVRNDANEEVAKAALDIKSWDLVAGLASDHRVSGLVLPALQKVDRPGATAAAFKLQDALFRQVAEVALLESELKRVVTALGGADIDVIVLKGPALARSVYPAPYLRPYDDIDVAVATHDIGRATGALTAAGYEPIVDGPRKGMNSTRPAAHSSQLQFRSVTTKALIELHADPLQLGLPPVCESDRWSRAEPLPEVDGALMLAPCDQVVHLAVHAHKHGYKRLIWLKDIDLLVRSRRPLDWDVVVSTARREGVEGPVWYALCVTQELLRTPLPRHLVARLAPALPIRSIYKCIWPRGRVARMQGQSHWRAVQFEPDSLRGMLPSLLLLGRRGHRWRVVLDTVLSGAVSAIQPRS